MTFAAWPIRILVVLGMVLSAVLLLDMLPLSLALAWTLVGIVIVLGIAAIVWLTVEHRRLRDKAGSLITTIGAQTFDLPVSLRNRMPLIISMGDGLKQLFGTVPEKRRVIVGDGAIWVRLDNPAMLRETALALRVWRDGSEPDGVLLTLVPANHANEEAIAGAIRVMRGAVSDANRALGRALPCFVAIYQRWSTTDDQNLPHWYGLAQNTGLAANETFEPVLQAAERRVQRAGGDIRAAWDAAGLAAVVEWTRKAILPVLSDNRQPSAPCRLHAIGWINQGPATSTASPLERYLADRTTIAPSAFPASTGNWLLPQPLVLATAMRVRLPAWVRSALAAFTLLMVFLMAAFWASAHNNHGLLGRVAGDLARFRSATSPAAHAGLDEQRKALAVVKADRDEIDRYRRLGVPLRLDFGLYHGTGILPPLTRAIDGYHEPEPTMLVFDSLSLFDPASAVLKPDATKALITALEFIQAHAGSRILIAGYTDTTGNPALNQRLSLKRAEAVRDWLVSASNVSITRIAVQGMGAQHPLADNSTAAGRARNRRVEITLIPDVHGPATVNPEHPAPTDPRHDLPANRRR